MSSIKTWRASGVRPRTVTRHQHTRFAPRMCGPRARGLERCATTRTPRALARLGAPPYLGLVRLRPLEPLPPIWLVIDGVPTPCFDCCCRTPLRPDRTSHYSPLYRAEWRASSSYLGLAAALVGELASPTCRSSSSTSAIPASTCSTDGHSSGQRGGHGHSLARQAKSLTSSCPTLRSALAPPQSLSALDAPPRPRACPLLPRDFNSKAGAPPREILARATPLLAVLPKL